MPLSLRRLRRCAALHGQPTSERGKLEEEEEVVVVVVVVVVVLVVVVVIVVVVLARFGTVTACGIKPTA